MTTTPFKPLWSRKVKWGAIPERMHPGVVNYVERGVPPGHFLTAVFSNNLMEACKRGDDENLQLIGDYAKLIYNQCPGMCWGSPANVAEWIQRGGIQGNTKHEPLPIHEWGRWADQHYQR